MQVDVVYICCTESANLVRYVVRVMRIRLRAQPKIQIQSAAGGLKPVASSFFG